MQQDLHPRYEAALARLAQVLEIEVDEASRILGDIVTAARVAQAIKGFFGRPEIEEALDDVVKVSLEHQAISSQEKSRKSHTRDLVEK